MEQLLGKEWALHYPKSLAETQKYRIEDALLVNLSRGGYHELHSFLRALHIIQQYPLTSDE